MTFCSLCLNCPIERNARSTLVNSHVECIFGLGHNLIDGVVACKTHSKRALLERHPSKTPLALLPLQLHGCGHGLKEKLDLAFEMEENM